MNARSVLGQPDFTSITTNRGGPPAANTMKNPMGVVVHNGRLYVADGNDRVLVFNSIPTGPGVPADALLGQAVFTSQDHNQCNCATAAANTMWGVHHVVWDGCRLYVTDRQNHRVLIF